VWRLYTLYKLNDVFVASISMPLSQVFLVPIVKSSGSCVQTLNLMVTYDMHVKHMIGDFSKTSEIYPEYTPTYLCVYSVRCDTWFILANRN
jgi:hypothetical protein